MDLRILPYQDLECSGTAVDGVVHLVDDVRSTNGSVVEVSTIQTLEGFLTTGDRVEFHKDLAIGVGVHSDVNDLAILAIALSLDFVLKIFSPGRSETS